MNTSCNSCNLTKNKLIFISSDVKKVRPYKMSYTYYKSTEIRQHCRPVPLEQLVT